MKLLKKTVLVILAVCFLLAVCSCGTPEKNYSDALLQYEETKVMKTVAEYFKKNIPDATDISYQLSFADNSIAEVMTGYYCILDESYQYAYDMKTDTFYSEETYKMVLDEIRELFLATHDFGKTTIDVVLPEIRLKASVVQFEGEFDESKADEIKYTEAEIPVSSVLDMSMSEKQIEEYAENMYKSGSIKLNFHPEDLEKFAETYKLTELALVKELPNIDFWFINKIDGYETDATVWYRQHEEDGKYKLDRRYSKSANVFETETLAEEKA